VIAEHKAAVMKTYLRTILCLIVASLGFLAHSQAAQTFRVDKKITNKVNYDHKGKNPLLSTASAFFDRVSGWVHTHYFAIIVYSIFSAHCAPEISMEGFSYTDLAPPRFTSISRSMACLKAVS